MSQPLRIGAVLYPGFEMLDLFGPLEMFSMLGTDQIAIHTIAEETGPVASAMGAEVGVGPKTLAEQDFANAPTLDLILLPGGFGTVPQLENEALLQFLVTRAAEARVVASVCTGSAILARAGLLAGKRATSNKQFFALATQQSDQVTWVPEARWVEDGKFYTSSGVSAGMDMALAIITNLFGAEVAETVVKGTEYSWHKDPHNDPFASELNTLAAAFGMV